MELELINSNKKYPQVAHKGFLYNFHKECSNFLRWRCSKNSSMKCPCFLKTNLNIAKPTLISVNNDHVHESNENFISATKIKNLMVEKAKLTNDLPAQIFAEVVSNVPRSILAELPKEEYLKRTIRNHRACNDPPKPTCGNEIIIEGEYREYGNERFLLYDNGPNSDDRILMFATDNYLSLLAKSDTWFVDGNFGLAPEFFKQLYVIRVQINSVFVTSVYCVLQKKSQSTYEKIFSILLKECQDRDLYPDPKFLHLDFELAVINAAKNIFGTHITINGCFYHLCQSTHRKIQKLGLSGIYKEDNNFRKYCGMIDGLAFLPQDKVLDGMTCLKEIMPPDAEDLLTYFDSYYVNGTYRRVGSASTLHFRKIPPIFSPASWNVHNATLVGGHRTNNMTEGWNNRFSKLCGHKHPTIWKLIRKIKMEISADEAKLALDAVGDSKTVKKLGQTRTVEKRLQNLCIQIQAGNIGVLDFLTAETPAAPPAPAPVAAAPEQQSTVNQVASEAKTLVDKTAAELKPALDQAVHDKINPLAQDLAKKLQPIAGDVSAHVNTALAEGVKQLNPIVDQVSTSAKGFVDDAAKQVSTVVDDKLKEADQLFSEKRDALGEPAKSMMSKAKGLFG